MWSKEQMLTYWHDPDFRNLPETYLDIEKNLRSLYIVDTLRELYLPFEATILELGCNVGRNLHFIHQAGFKNITGVEINPNAIALGETTYPELKGKLIESTIEDYVKTCPSYDVIFTQSVLMHIHPDSNWVFPLIEKKINKYLITCEAEMGIGTGSPRCVERDYGEMFNLKQLKWTRGIPAISKFHVFRIFTNEYLNNRSESIAERPDRIGDSSGS